MRTAEFDYDLPQELIAQEPPPAREDARLLVLGRRSGAARHRGMRDLPEELRPGDLLVTNDTRVLPARVFAQRSTGGRVEILFVEPVLEPMVEDGAWRTMVRAGGALRAGEELRVGDGVGLRLVRSEGSGRWVVRPTAGSALELMERCGKSPLPPYIHRERLDTRDAADRERYQTVFARHAGAVAAPTAGLHLTEALLRRARDRGVEVAAITLHVGLGTFLPIRTDDLDTHRMHTERYVVPRDAAEALRRARERGGRVVAVGTTTVRTLEAAARETDDGLPRAGAACTDLFIRPGHEFGIVDALLTNFHLPRSTLLCLVSAFAGRDRVLAAYRAAVAERYRFYSYGDAMLIA